MLTIRFGYCPPNPGPKAKIYNKWYSDIKNAIDEYNGRDRIYISYNKKAYRQITFEQLYNLYESESTL